MDALSAPHFHDDTAARELLESIRWQDGRPCPHCGVIDHSYALKKPGLYRCAEPECRKDFTVTTKSVMESSHIKLHKWMQGFFLMASSKKGISAHQLHRMLGIGYKAAWFMCHRIREAMRAGDLDPLGGAGMEVEADETYYGPIEKAKRRTTRTTGEPFLKPAGKQGRHGGPANKRAIVALVERGGQVRSFHVPTADKASVTKIVTDNIARESFLYTDEPNSSARAHAFLVGSHNATRKGGACHMGIINGIAPPETVHLRKVDRPILPSSEGTSLAELHLRGAHKRETHGDEDTGY